VTRLAKTSGVRRRPGRVLGVFLGAISLREEPRDVRLRAQAVMGSAILATVGLAAILAVILITGADGLILRGAEQRAQHGLDMLVTVGANMPALTPRALDHGLTPESRRELDAAVRRGQDDHVLSSMTIWNVHGNALYSLDGGAAAWLRSPMTRNQLGQVLRGHKVTFASPTELDLSSHRRTGTLQAFEPLRDSQGRVFGAIEVDLPLQPILDQTGHERTGILIFVIAALGVLWLLFLPVTTRATMSIARSWKPGRRRLLSDFQRALDRDEIELLYQPQIWIKDGNVHGFEALVRWRRDGSLQTPDTFLPVVEDSALMTDLTHRVIGLAAAQLAAWRRQGYTPRVSINLSAKDLEDDTLAARIDSALTRHQVPSDQLTVEVTETAILNDTDCAQRVLTDISALGVQIAVDDFGTGHASISRLHQFPIDEVKIDRSFVIPTDSRTRTYLKAIIRFTQALGVRVVAEGIEEEWTLTFLRDLSCDVAQGYHIGRPLPAGQSQDWLSDNTRFNAAVRNPAPMPLADPASITP
jgi:EAL domain-containing protein (putative c-di-GMP-specific phosphodiesterase class I)